MLVDWKAGQKIPFVLQSLYHWSPGGFYFLLDQQIQLRHVCACIVVLPLQREILSDYQNQLYVCLQQMYLGREEQDCLI